MVGADFSCRTSEKVTVEGALSASCTWLRFQSRLTDKLESASIRKRWGIEIIRTGDQDIGFELPFETPRPDQRVL